MKESISKIKRYNLQVITVTQDLSDLKNISDDTVKAIVENCNVHITLAQDKDVVALMLEKKK
ncbi:TraM recognition domain-containing protein [Yersinia enterocolitica]|uniref:TraM recognition domain-containing protein n=1 Tax=Serratia fonticola TaxID=47917 RepID=UPI0027FA3F14|nr:TraM recognition domain-containing protein [Serratia fonticola]MDQ7212358.1 TraM recognition domain-containing protein [Serratia fonticola]